MNLSTSLQEWANTHKPDESMIWKKSFWNQIVFVRDELPKTLIEKYNYSLYEAIGDEVRVISTHTSKSILLPVYKISYPGRELTFIVRNNFHDWKVSVISCQPIEADFGNLFDPTQKVSSTYCEGFDPSWVFGSHEENNMKFTVEIRDNFEMYTFFWLIRQALKLP